MLVKVSLHSDHALMHRLESTIHFCNAEADQRRHGATSA